MGFEDLTRFKHSLHNLFGKSNKQSQTALAPYCTRPIIERKARMQSLKNSFFLVRDWSSAAQRIFSTFGSDWDTRQLWVVSKSEMLGKRVAAWPWYYCYLIG